MKNLDKMTINEDVVTKAVVEIKLCVNRRLRERGVITEEMYERAKELILKGDRQVA